MADIFQLTSIQEDEESLSHFPPGLSASSAYASEILHNAILYEPRPDSPIEARDRDRRRESYASHVSIDYFDPAGVDELRRSLSLASNSIRQPEDELRPKSPVPSISSEVTLAPGDGPFDFQKSLQQIMKK